MKTYDEEVARGAAFLDENEPGWRERVDPELLDMQHCRFCVLGQVFGDYFTALDQDARLQDRDPAELGFDAIERDGHPYATRRRVYDRLGDAWLRELRRSAP